MATVTTRTCRATVTTCHATVSVTTRTVHSKLDALDTRVRSSARRSDILVSLPAMLATIAPLVWLTSITVAILVNVTLTVPVLVKIIRTW